MADEIENLYEIQRHPDLRTASPSVLKNFAGPVGSPENSFYEEHYKNYRPVVEEIQNYEVRLLIL